MFFKQPKEIGLFADAGYCIRKMDTGFYAHGCPSPVAYCRRLPLASFFPLLAMVQSCVKSIQTQ